MYARYKNRNRGYQQLRVWQDAIAYYRLTCSVFRGFRGELLRVASQAIASADSVHRNIAEGYCRQSLKEYRQFIGYALGSLGESVSGVIAYREAEQMSQGQYEELDTLAFKLENALLKLRDSLQDWNPDDWSERRMVRESNALYG